LQSGIELKNQSAPVSHRKQFNSGGISFTYVTGGGWGKSIGGCREGNGAGSGELHLGVGVKERGEEA
jgi:hypothetical protein